MKKNWQIRSATVDDATALHKCMILAYAGYQERMQGRRLPPMELDYRAEISEYPTWVAEYNDNIVGGLTMIFKPDDAAIANIAVHPDFQGQGLGKGLMNFADAQARQRNYSQLCLATHVLLSENVSLYRHLGWIEYDRDDVRVYMRKYIK